MLCTRGWPIEPRAAWARRDYAAPRSDGIGSAVEMAGWPPGRFTICTATLYQILYGGYEEYRGRERWNMQRYILTVQEQQNRKTGIACVRRDV